MQLTATTLRQMLVAILKVPEAYIVPRQGNWWNPQAGLPLAQRPQTWCAYAIESDVPVTKPYYEPEEDDSGDQVNVSVQQRAANVALQFVGPDAELVAQSVGHWLQREDVAEQLDLVSGRLFTDGTITTVDFAQDGANTVKAYTVRIRILWASTVVADQALVRSAVFEGGRIL